MFIYELSCFGFESRCWHLNFVVLWHVWFAMLREIHWNFLNLLITVPMSFFQLKSFKLYWTTKVLLLQKELMWFIENEQIYWTEKLLTACSSEDCKQHEAPAQCYQSKQYLIWSHNARVYLALILNMIIMKSFLLWVFFFFFFFVLVVYYITKVSS